MFSLMQALEKIENVQPTDESTKQNVDRLKGLLFRLRKVYQLNQIASVRNNYLNTDNISPYNYESMLRLVQLLGSTQTIGQQFNPLTVMFRTWMNFFNGGNIFTALLNPLQIGVTNSPKKPTPPKYDPNKLQSLITMLNNNEANRQQMINNNRQQAALANLIRTQNQQQQQINEILQALVNKPSNNSSNKVST